MFKVSSHRLILSTGLMVAAVAVLGWVTPDVTAQGYQYGSHYRSGYGSGYGSNYSMGGFNFSVGNNYGGLGHSSFYGGYGRGGIGVYRPYYYPQAPIWHDTTHYDYHRGRIIRHGNHFDYVPGHFHLHRSGHWDY